MRILALLFILSSCGVAQLRPIKRLPAAIDDAKLCRHYINSFFKKMLIKDFLRQGNATAGILKGGQVHHGAESGFFKKIDMIKRARPGTEINLAYFIYEDDYTSSYLSKKLIEATKRGVKVNILTDYFMSIKHMDLMSYLQSQPEVNVKLWRPASKEFRSYLTKNLKLEDEESFLLGFATQNPGLIIKGIQSSSLLPKLSEKISESMKEIEKISSLAPKEAAGYKMLLLHQILTQKDLLSLAPQLARMPNFIDTYLNRMHHKTLSVVTNNGLEVIVGGRNISDEYHIGLEELKLKSRGLLKGRGYPFIDSEVSGIFSSINDEKDYRDGFRRMWNATSNLLFIPKEISPKSKIYYEQKQNMLTKASLIELRAPSLRTRIESGTSALHAEDTTAVRYTENPYDDDLKKKEILIHWKKLIEHQDPKKGDIEIVSAYMYLYPEILSSLKIAADKGVKISIYTNSPTTTDLSIVNIAAYKDFSSWQKELNPNGTNKVKFFELALEKGEGSLHAKIIKVGNTIAIGSANVDPRNFRGDTNNMMFLDFGYNPAFAREVFHQYLGRPDHYPWKELTQKDVDQFLKEARKERQFNLILYALELDIVKNEI